MSTRCLLVSTSLELIVQVYAPTLTFLFGLQRPNSGPRACMEGTLWAELSPQPRCRRFLLGSLPFGLAVVETIVLKTFRNKAVWADLLCWFKGVDRM